MANTSVTLINNGGVYVPSVPSVAVNKGDTVSFATNDGSVAQLFFSPGAAAVLSPAPGGAFAIPASGSASFTFTSSDSGAYSAFVGASGDTTADELPQPGVAEPFTAYERRCGDSGLRCHTRYDEPRIVDGRTLDHRISLQVGNPQPHGRIAEQNIVARIVASNRKARDRR